MSNSSNRFGKNLTQAEQLIKKVGLRKYCIYRLGMLKKDNDPTLVEDIEIFKKLIYDLSKQQQ